MQLIIPHLARRLELKTSDIKNITRAQPLRYNGTFVWWVKICVSTIGLHAIITARINDIRFKFLGRMPDRCSLRKPKLRIAEVTTRLTIRDCPNSRIPDNFTI